MHYPKVISHMDSKEDQIEKHIEYLKHYLKRWKGSDEFKYRSIKTLIQYWKDRQK